MLKIEQLVRCNRRLLQNVYPLVSGDFTSHCRKFSSNSENKNKNEFSYMNDSRNNKQYVLPLLSALGVSIGVGIYYFSNRNKRTLIAASPCTEVESLGGQPIRGLPLYTLKDVAKHSTKETRIWVTYNQGVYDITDFVDEHPGGSIIMMAAGGALDPFWLIYGLHKGTAILKMLETYRIGNLSQKEAKDNIKDVNDPYSADPKRHPALIVNLTRPFCAEPPSTILTESFITPAELFYVRNHLPVPEVDPAEYNLTIGGIGVKSTEMSLNDIKQFPKHTITATLQCAGNRRMEMAKVKPMKGLSWSVGAMGCATFSGAKLRDVLISLGYDECNTKAKHVQFEGLDLDPANNPYGASIPIEKAMDPKGDVLIAYEMNGMPLLPDHGFPVRMLVPGNAGARSVKWLGAITVAEEESNTHWQRIDYKGFSPSTEWENADFESAPAIQALPVTSAICDPTENDTVKVINGKITLKGYAWSGGGSKIVRVDITPDCGKTWYVADITNQETKNAPHHWSWSLWKAEIPIKTKDSSIEVWVKAVDSSFNTQPETFENTYNFRGVLANAYHRVRINLKH
ncbi:sulfite oxidase [Lycorma delicatula]|uniref:sulfite oxidase n=1 Tax=Lycorma delicatula TaxID=130591 RepID=UPI003F51AB27